MAFRALIVLGVLSSSAWAFRRQRKQAGDVSAAACGDVVVGAQTSNGNTADMSCKCRPLYVLSGADDACSQVFGEREFNPAPLDGKGCQCASMALLFLPSLSDMFGGIGEDVHDNIRTLNSWVDDVKGNALTKAADLEEKWAEIEEGVAQNIDNLKANLAEASAETKSLFVAQIEELGSKLMEVRIAIEGVLRESMQNVDTNAREMFATVKIDLQSAAEGKKAELLESAGMLKARLFEMHASAMSAAPSSQSLEVATELISDTIGRLQEQRSQNWYDVTKRFDLDKQIAQYEEQRKLLRSAAINTGKELGAASARFVEVVATRVGTLREMLQTAAAETKAEIEDEISRQMDELTQVHDSAVGQRADLRMQITKAIEGLGEDIGKLQEQLKNAWFFEKAPIERQIKKFKERLAQLRSGAVGKQADVEARLMKVMFAVSEGIGELREQARITAEDQKASIDESINHLSQLRTNLKVSATSQHSDLTARADTFKILFTDYIAKTTTAMSEATAANREVLEVELQEFKSLLARLDQASTDLKLDVFETLTELTNALHTSLETASESHQLVLSEKLLLLDGQLQSLKDDSASATVDAANTARESAIILAEYIGELPTGQQDELRTWLQQLQAVSASAGGKLDTLLADAVELCSTSGGLLEATLEAASTESKDLTSTLVGWFQHVSSDGAATIATQLMLTRDLLTQVRNMSVALKTRKEMEIVEFTTTLGENVGQFKEKLAASASALANEEWVERTIGELSSQLSVLKTTAGVMRAELEAQLMDVASTVSEQIGEFKATLVAVTNNQSQSSFQHNIARLEGRLDHLRAAGAKKFDEGQEALVKVADSCSLRVGEYQEKLKIATSSERAQWRERLDALMDNLEEIKHASQGMLGLVQEQMSSVSGTVSTFVGELQVKLSAAAADKKAEVQAGIVKFEEHLTTLKTTMSKNVMPKLEAVYKKMDEQMSALETEMYNTNAEHASEVQDRIVELTARKAQLVTAVANRKAAVHAVLDALATKIKKYVTQLDNDMQAASGVAKESMESRKVELLALHDDLTNAIADTMAEADLRAVVQQFKDQLVAYKTIAAEQIAFIDPAVFAETFAGWLDVLASATDDEGLADVVGAAVTIQVILDLQVEVHAHGVTVASSLVDVGNTVSLSTRTATSSDMFHDIQQTLWMIVAERAKELHCGETLNEPCTSGAQGSVPEPTPSPTPKATPSPTAAPSEKEEHQGKSAALQKHIGLAAVCAVLCIVM